MEVDDAIRLIEVGLPGRDKHSTWADLGCGSGTFTNALAALLGEESKIYAVDKQDQQINSSSSGKEIEFVKLDFLQQQLPFFNLDGILMANALHYVKEKIRFLEDLKTHLKAHGRMIIVEYDTEKQNQWVPYPMSYTKIVETFTSMGLTNITKIGERNSIYRSGKMYACVAKLQ